jgi:hypothetical protein
VTPCSLIRLSWTLSSNQLSAPTLSTIDEGRRPLETPVTIFQTNRCHLYKTIIFTVSAERIQNGYSSYPLQIHFNGGSEFNAAEILNSSILLSVFAWFPLPPWRWRRSIPWNRRLTYIELQFVISQKTKLYILTLSPYLRLGSSNYLFPSTTSN